MPRTPADFGTERHPIHASAVPSIIRCSLRALMHFLLQPDDEAGEAADTGSATEATVTMHEVRGKYHKADLGDAAHLFFGTRGMRKIKVKPKWK